MSGYCGYSKSNNAVLAENEGRTPLTTAIKLVRAATGCTTALARKVLEEGGAGERHHTSKKYNLTDFYDTIPAIGFIRQRAEIERFKAINEKIQFISGDINSCDTAFTAFAAKHGFTVDFIYTCYYGTWEDFAE